MAKYSREPTVLWTKVFCPICREPTGPTSKCPEMYDKNNPKTLLSKLGPLAIMSPSCIYRQSNMWTAHFNYTVSENLLQHLSKVVGIEDVRPVKSYSVQLAVASAFDQDDVKADVVRSFKEFVYSLSATESSLRPEVVDIFDLELPNGEVIVGSPENVSVLTLMVEDLPGSKRLKKVVTPKKLDKE